MTRFQLHVQRWADGCGHAQCSGHKTRRVFCRGQLPCDVLLVGEAPGVSENARGIPFDGPAGKLLDQIVSRATAGHQVRVAFTNVVACIPRDEEGQKFHEPDDDQVESCRPRLEDFIDLASPRLVVAVGKVAEGWLEQGYKHSIRLPATVQRVVSIVHPAAILRANMAARGLMAQRCSVTIDNATEELT